MSHMILLIVLISYWMIPLPLAAGYGITNPSRTRVVFLVILYATGIILMMGADYQKNTTLKKQKGSFKDTQGSSHQHFSNTLEIQTI